MADREKVIAGLEHCKVIAGDCGSCPYNNTPNLECTTHLACDALEMLKEQDNLEKRHKVLVEKFDDLLATIKEMDVVRCKDCKYAHLTYDGECKYCDYHKDEDGNYIELYYPGDWFCAAGGRRDADA